MVSAAKLRRAQDAIIKLRPFASKFHSILTNILDNLDGGIDSPYAKKREVHNALVVVVTSNRGLCGAFNSNIIKMAMSLIDEKYADVRKAGNLSIMCVGKRGCEFFKKRYTDCNIIDEHMLLFNDMEYQNVEKVADKVLGQYTDGTYDAVDVVFGRFKNPAMQFPETFNFLPIPIKKDHKKKARADYLFEPSKEVLLNKLIPSILRTDFYRFMLDTNASEHGARMTAMEKATENAKELQKELRLTYNKARQEAITKELSEIVGGAAALEG